MRVCCVCVRACVHPGVRSLDVRAAHVRRVHTAFIGGVHRSDPPPPAQNAHSLVVGSWAVPSGDPLTSSLAWRATSRRSAEARVRRVVVDAAAAARDKAAFAAVDARTHVSE